MGLVGTPPPTRAELGRVADRYSFVYFERATIHRDANALTATDQEGVIHVPVAMLGCLLLGPGTRVTHAAMSLLGECGASVVWVGENGIRYYAQGQSLARSSRLLIEQAKLVSNTRSRLEVARKMYAYRFPGEDVSELTMQQLRGREGARVRQVYRMHAERTGAEWDRREYSPGNFDDGSPVNQALTAANVCLYGIVHSVVVALGCAPGLGFVHTGQERSFVFDVADLYKAEVSIPAAFEAAAHHSDSLSADVRRLVRDKVVSARLLERCAKDIAWLLMPESSGDVEEWVQEDRLSLWSGRGDQQVEGGVNYGGDAP